MLWLGIHLCKNEAKFCQITPDSKTTKKKNVLIYVDVGGQERKDSLRQLNAFGPCMWRVWSIRRFEIQ